MCDVGGRRRGVGQVELGPGRGQHLVLARPGIGQDVAPDHAGRAGDEDLHCDGRRENGHQTIEGPVVHGIGADVEAAFVDGVRPRQRRRRFVRQQGHHRLVHEIARDDRTGLDAAGGQPRHDRVAVPAAGLQRQAEAEPAALADLALETQAFDGGQTLLETPRRLAPRGDEGRNPLQLLDPDGPGDLRRPDVVSRQDEAERLVEVAARVLLHEGVRPRQVAGPAVGAKAEQQMVKLLVVGDADAAFHGRDVVAEEGAEGTDPAERPRGPAAEPRAQGLAVVLQQGDRPPLQQPATAAKSLGLPRRLAAKTTSTSSSRARSSPARSKFRVSGSTSTNRSIETVLAERIIGRRPRHRRHHGNPAGPRERFARVEQGGDGQQVGRGAAVDHDGEPGADHLREVGLEGADLVAHGGPAALDHGDRRGPFGVAPGVGRQGIEEAAFNGAQDTLTMRLPIFSPASSPTSA